LFFAELQKQKVAGNNNVSSGRLAFLCWPTVPKGQRTLSQLQDDLQGCQITYFFVCPQTPEQAGRNVRKQYQLELYFPNVFLSVNSCALALWLFVHLMGKSANGARAAAAAAAIR
jgi:hypothetical protein